MFAMWLWYGLMVAGVIVLRYKQPGLARPYRMWGYPVTPALFVAIACWFLVNMLKARPLPSVAGLLLIATGIPALPPRAMQHAAGDQSIVLAWQERTRRDYKALHPTTKSSPLHKTH